MTTDMYRIRTVLQQTAGNPLLSTMFFDTTGVDASDCANAVFTLWDDLSPLLSTDLTFQVQASPEIINAADGSLVGVAPSGASTIGAGTATQDPLPFATQGLLRWGTATIVGGRILKGRTFIPGLTEDANVSGNPTGSCLTSMLAAATTFLSSPVQFGVWSRPITSGPHARAGSFAAASGVQAWSQFAVLRSRRS